MLVPISVLSFSSAPRGETVVGFQDTPPAGTETAPEQAPAGGTWGMWLPMLAILVVFWVVMIGPERKNRKRREAMLAALKKGDRVMTTSGIYGTVVQVQDNVVTVAIADGVRVRFSRAAIQGLEEERASADDKGGEQATKEKNA